jgi:magnesium-transporting ATPase (P-type)
MQKGDEKKIAATAEAIKNLKDVSDFKYHKMTAQDVLKQIDSSETQGLTKFSVEQRISKYGQNELDEEEGPSLWERIKEQFEDLLARILLFAATISFVIAITGDGEEGIAAYVEPFVILLILVLNALVAIYQD